MITLNASGGSVTFTFSGNSTYLNDGTITVPVNSLALIIDESNMATFRKAASNDIFVSANIAEFGMTKAELEAWYKANMVGSTGGGSGSGVTPSEVQTMIDESISGKADTSYVDQSVSGKADSSTVTQEIDAAVSGKADSSAVTEEISEAVSGKVDTTTYSAYTAATDTALAGKQDTLSAGTGIDITSNVISVTGSTGGKAIEAGRGISVTTGETADTVSFNLPISAGTGTGALVIASDTYKLTDKATGNYAVSLNGGGSYPNYAQGRNSLAEGENTSTYSVSCHAEGNATKAGDPTYMFNGKSAHAEGDSTVANANFAHAEGHGTSATSVSSHAEGNYTIARNEYEHASGQYNVSNTGASTSAQTLFSVGNGEWNARHNAFEIRKNGDIYIQSGNTDILLQDHLGGGGSLNIPISAGTGTYSIQENAGSALGGYSHAEGSNTTASGDYSHAEGYNTMAISAYSHTEGWQTEANGLAAHAEGYTTKADGENSHAEGNMTETNNLGEHASGSYNLSHKASNTFGDSGNTLFSVGNGTSTGTSRHNAFEIRQNGDIYFEYDGADTKLQDKLDEIESVTAAALNNLNSRLGGLSLVKLTQTEYDNLQTKDSNTLYVIVG